MGWTHSLIEDDCYGSRITDSRAWLKACSEIEDGKHFVLQYEETLLPLSWINRNGVMVIEALGQDYRSVAGPLKEGPDFPKVRLQDFPLTADLIDLRRFPKKYLKFIHPAGAIRIVRKDISHYSRELKNSPEALLKSLSTNARGTLRQANNRVAKDFADKGLKFDKLKLDGENWDESWRQMSTIADHSWQGKSNVSVFKRKKMRSFLFNLMNNGMRLTFYQCLLGNEIIAVTLCAINSNNLLIYLQEYNENFTKYRPGHLLNNYIFNDAALNGINWIDYGVGSGPHKDFWRFNPTDLYRLMIPLTMKGALAVAKQCLRWYAGGFARKKSKAE